MASATGPAWAAAERAGCDMSLIEVNLSLSYEARCAQHDRALAQALALQTAARNQIDGLSRALAETR